MSNADIINELAGIRASAQVLQERATRLESQLRKGDVSTTPASKQFQIKMAGVLANREKRYQKK
jgi:hypothetical protein